MRIKRTFFLAALIEVVIISGCACPKRNIQQHEKPIQVEIATNESQKAKPNPIEEKGNLFRESWTKLRTGMTVGELTRLFGSELGLSYCNQPSACQWSPKLTYYGFPEIKAEITFKFEGGKLTDWSPKVLPPK